MIGPGSDKNWFSKHKFKTDLDSPIKKNQKKLIIQTQIQNRPWFPKARWRYPASSSFRSQLPLGRWSLGWVLFFLFTVKTVVIILKAEVWVEVCSCCIHCNLSKMETLPEYFVQVFCAQDVGQDGLVRQDWCDCFFDRRPDKLNHFRGWLDLRNCLLQQVVKSCLFDLVPSLIFEKKLD